MEQRKYKYGKRELTWFDKTEVNKKNANLLWFFEYNRIKFKDVIPVDEKAEEFARHGIMVGGTFDLYDRYYKLGEEYVVIDSGIYNGEGCKLMSNGQIIKAIVAIKMLNPDLTKRAIWNTGMHILRNFNLCPLGAKMDVKDRMSLVKYTMDLDPDLGFYYKRFSWDVNTLRLLFKNKKALAMNSLIGKEVVNGMYKLDEVERNDILVAMNSINPNILLADVPEWRNVPHGINVDVEHEIKSIMAKVHNSNRKQDIRGLSLVAMEELHDSEVLISHKDLAIKLGVNIKTIKREFKKSSDLGEKMSKLNDSLKIIKSMDGVRNFIKENGRLPKSRSEFRKLILPPIPDSYYLDYALQFMRMSISDDKFNLEEYLEN